ncbi:hypothetical protein F4777DRAFT_590983 [Nemania sp. FL0916]|nr:hypothetical protein F4777DRAFT_590983 [Nemania sp. FL0916]
MEALVAADIDAKYEKYDFYNLGFESDDDSVVADQGNAHSALDSPGADTPTNTIAPTTPKGPSGLREVHTVSKVPLKPADDSTPRGIKRPCADAAEMTIAPNLRANNTKEETALAPPQNPPTSTSVGTLARTTRPDLNPTLLRGVKVFVDVHTTEGADASEDFVELLMKMGAHCVMNVSRVGITHVVFKDGSKRTLEKVNQSNGAIRCVGVNWILDCQIENRWVDEKDYRVDTSVVPRGGQNRRKSMEPKAIANLNGTLVTPAKPAMASREPQTVPGNYMSRRDSTLWERSPSSTGSPDPDEMDWEPASEIRNLTPPPQTPAPETVARFALDVTPGTPTGDSPPLQDQVHMQTCPPKPRAIPGLGQLGNQPNPIPGLGQLDSQPSAIPNLDPVQARLMEARKKTMQYAPKIASPLKKQLKRPE